jgi:hypothetical protein
VNAPSYGRRLLPCGRTFTSLSQTILTYTDRTRTHWLVIMPLSKWHTLRNPGLCRRCQAPNGLSREHIPCRVSSMCKLMGSSDIRTVSLEATCFLSLLPFEHCTSIHISSRVMVSWAHEFTHNIFYTSQAQKTGLITSKKDTLRSLGLLLTRFAMDTHHIQSCFYTVLPDFSLCFPLRRARGQNLIIYIYVYTEKCPP